MSFQIAAKSLHQLHYRMPTLDVTDVQSVAVMTVT
jgi:hypothetical protein